MYRFFYNIIIQLFYLGIRIAALWHPKAKAWVAGRKDWRSTMKSTFKAAPHTVTWFHCASLGEFEQGRPLMEKIKQAQPEQLLLLTFFSPSGYEIRKNYQGVDYVYYLPVDTASNASDFLAIIQPRLAIFIKYEFWYHFLNTLQQHTIPTYVVAAIFRPSQYFFKWYGAAHLSLLQDLQHIFVQEEGSKKLLQDYGCTHVSVAGDPRIDRVVQIAAGASTFPIVKSFKSNKPLLILGSTHPKDIAVWLPFLQQNTFWKVLLVPHEVHPSAIERIQAQLPTPSLCYTQVKEQVFTIDSSFLIVDTIGILNQLYQYADVVYIGGGFGTGIHNTLEPAVFGVPILIGPNYSKFEEAKKMDQLGGIEVVESASDIIAVMHLFESSSFRQRIGSINKKYIADDRGSTEKIYALLSKFLNKKMNR